MVNIKLFVSFSFLFILLNIAGQTAYTGMRGLSGLDITAEMAPGINLFNTLDAYCWYYPQDLESETCWGNPYTTIEMVTAFKKRGFKTLRIPVTWFNHMGPAPDYIIDSAWMNRVEEVANYAFDNEMYVIINIHHDDYEESHIGSWLCPTYKKQTAITDQLEKLWIQIANRFKNYGDYLIFETMNEPREVGSTHEWNGGSTEHREVVNAFNLAAVNAIRKTGGNNSERFIMIPQVAGSTGAAKESLIIPNNDTNIIVSVHSYFPYSFCLENPGTSTWGSASEIAALKNEIQSLSDHFVANGQAVIMGEWGVDNKNNYAERVNYYDIYVNACKEAGITPVTWMYEFNRTILSWEYPMVEDAILQVYDTNAVAIEELILDITSDTLFVGDTLRLTATILPDSVTSKDILWTSTNKMVASITDDGLITARAGGRATIKATAIGKRSNCNILIIDPTSTNEIRFTENQVRVYPNPANELLTIDLPKPASQIILFSVEGRQIIHTQPDEAEVQLDISETKPGIYFLQIITEDKHDTKLIVIE